MSIFCSNWSCYLPPWHWIPPGAVCGSWPTLVMPESNCSPVFMLNVTPAMGVLCCPVVRWGWDHQHVQWSRCVHKMHWPTYLYTGHTHAHPSISSTNCIACFGWTEHRKNIHRVIDMPMHPCEHTEHIKNIHRVIDMPMHPCEHTEHIKNIHRVIDMPMHPCEHTCT